MSETLTVCPSTMTINIVECHQICEHAWFSIASTRANATTSICLGYCNIQYYLALWVMAWAPGSIVYATKGYWYQEKFGKTIISAK